MKRLSINPVLFIIPVIMVLAIFVIMSAGGQDVRAAVTGPCDIYAEGGTPCVAAHSTVRALYGSYNGNLYQVRRTSDNTTKDIPVLTPGGFANTALVDSFCAGTTCTISIIYDQSPKANHLPKSPKALWLPNGGKEAPIISAAKINVSGHPVYGVYVNADQVAYRNNKTNGIAVGDQPESMYMVVDGKRYSDICCFDYGNAETDGQLGPSGSMEAVYWGTDITWGGKGEGNGPWIAGDFENGMFKSDKGGWGSESLYTPSAKSIIANFATCMLKGPSGNHFTLKGGNAQSGTLTTMWDGARPSPNYAPKSLEGAIILGTGGDGSPYGKGTFFEGCMTSGVPSDAVDNAIQANIVAAGYGSNVTVQPTATSLPTATPGPQSAFSQIEAENFSSQSGIQTETCNEGGQDVGFIENGDYIVFNNLNFGSGASSFKSRVASATSGGNIEIRLDGINGTLIGTCPVAGTGDWQTWTTATCNTTSVSGIHNLYLVFTGGSGYLFNINWIQFVAGATPTPVGVKGDVNGDGTVDIVDALMIAQYCVGLNPSGFIPANADTNCDGVIDIVDALLIAQYSVGLINKFC